MNVEVLYNSQQEFKKYLDRSGIIDNMTKVLIGIYEEPEKPLNAIEYIMDNFSNSGPNTTEIEDLKLTIKELEFKCQEMQLRNNELSTKISEYQSKNELKETIEDS